MLEITPEVPYTVAASQKPSVFLAGSIEMGRARLWQDEVVKELSKLDVTVFNPRRKQWDWGLDPTTVTPALDEQVRWEQEYMELADIVLFMFLGNTQSAISLLEYGKCYGEDKSTIVIVEPEFYRRGNLVIMQNMIQEPTYSSLEEALPSLIGALTHTTAQFMHCSMAGTYWIDCNVLKNNLDGTYLISYNDFIIKEVVTEVVDHHDLKFKL